jgi:hypothetical protein
MRDELTDRLIREDIQLTKQFLKEVNQLIVHRTKEGNQMIQFLNIIDKRTIIWSFVLYTVQYNVHLIHCKAPFGSKLRHFDVYYRGGLAPLHYMGSKFSIRMCICAFADVRHFFAMTELYLGVCESRGGALRF